MVHSLVILGNKSPPWGLDPEPNPILRLEAVSTVATIDGKLGLVGPYGAHFGWVPQHQKQIYENSQ